MRAASIRTKLLGLLAVPLAALAFVAALGVVWSANEVGRSRASVARTEAAVVSVRATLELSRERGLSAGTLAAPAATDLRRELEFQRGQTDVALDDLAPGAAADVPARLVDLRRAVDDADAAVDDVLAGYSGLVDPLLDDGTTRVRAITDSGLVGRWSTPCSTTGRPGCAPSRTPGWSGRASRSSH
jgi:hypothetical protein